MPAYKNKDGSWYCSFYYRNWKGHNKRKKKSGFKTRKEALEWERKFLEEKEGNLEMTFEQFIEIYNKERKVRLKRNTYETKKYLINGKTLPYFKDLKGFENE